MNYEKYLNETNPKVIIDVKNYGEIEVELFPSVAPITVENFLHLVTFHRVISVFMIQGGDPLGNGTGGSKNKIKGEFEANGVKNDLAHSRGVISMARAMNPTSAISQFFIMHKDAPHLDGNYAAFGAVVKGIDIVDKIASVRTDYYDHPLEDVIMNVKRVK